LLLGREAAAFPTRRGKFRGELALILEDLSSLAVEKQKGSSGNGLLQISTIKVAPPD
jgi:hypothetical protein